MRTGVLLGTRPRAATGRREDGKRRSAYRGTIGSGSRRGHLSWNFRLHPAAATAGFGPPRTPGDTRADVPGNQRIIEIRDSGQAPQLTERTILSGSNHVGSLPGKHGFLLGPRCTVKKIRLFGYPVRRPHPRSCQARNWSTRRRLPNPNSGCIMMRTRLCSIIAAGGLSLAAIAGTAPGASATPFLDGCTAVHGIPKTHTLSEPKNGGNIEESCAFLNDGGGLAWTVWNYYSTLPVRAPVGDIQEPPPPPKKGGPGGPGPGGPVTDIPTPPG